MAEKRTTAAVIPDGSGTFSPVLLRFPIFVLFPDLSVPFLWPFLTLHLLSLQLIASNTEGKSSPSEVLVCTTNPDKPGPPSAPCVTAATPYGFTVTWGKDITVRASELPQGTEG